MTEEATSVECIAKYDGKESLEHMRIQFEVVEVKHVINIDKIIIMEIKKTFYTMNRSEGRSFHLSARVSLEG